MTADRAADTEVPLLIWTIVEINVSIVSACLPTMRPLFLRTIRGKPPKASSYTSYPTKPSLHKSKPSSSESVRLGMEASDGLEPGARPKLSSAESGELGTGALTGFVFDTEPLDRRLSATTSIEWQREAHLS